MSWFNKYKMRRKFTIRFFTIGVHLGAAAACKISSILFWPVIAKFTLQKTIASEKENRRHFIKPGLMIFLFALLASRVFHPVAFVGQGGVLTLWACWMCAPIRSFGALRNTNRKFL